MMASVRNRSTRRVVRRRAALLVSALLLVAGLLQVAPTQAVPGSLDPDWGDSAFGVDGVSSIPPPLGFTLQASSLLPYNSLAVSPSGATWQVDLLTPTGGSGRSARVLRRAPDGTVGGSLTIPVGATQQVRLLPDGEGVVALAFDFLAGGGKVMKLTPAVSLDTSFGGDGEVQYADLGLPTGPCVFGVCPGFNGGAGLDSDGRLALTVGSDAAVRLLPDGQLDTDFGASGRAPFAANSYPSLVIDDQDRIVVTGSQGLRRLLSDGSPDLSFGPTGSGAVNLSAVLPGLQCFGPFCASVVAPDGAILLAATGPTMGIAEFSADGTSVEHHSLQCEGQPTCQVPISPFVTGSSPAQLHFVGALRLTTVDLPLPDGPLVVQHTEVPTGGLLHGAGAGTDPNVAFVAGVRRPAPADPEQSFVARLRLDVPPPPPPPPPTGTVSPPSGSWERGVSSTGDGPIVAVDYTCTGGTGCQALLAYGEQPFPLPPDYFDNAWGQQVTPGELVDLSDSGWDVQTLIVSAVDPGTGQRVELARARYELTYPGSAAGTTDDGGTVSTGTTVSRQDLMTTSVTTPTGGFVSISEQLGGYAPQGFQAFGQYAYVSAPDQTAAAPLSVTFRLHSSMLAGTPASGVKVWRDGMSVPNCVGGAGATAANPDPCVKQRSSLSGGAGAQVTVLSSQASQLTFGKLTAVAPSAPTSVVAEAAIRSAQVSWAEPEQNGGAAIDRYVVTATPVQVPDGVTAGVRSVTVNGVDDPAPTTATVPSLVPGVSYSFSVKARNAATGTFGPASAASDPVRVSALPGAPVISAAVSGIKSATVTWDAPQSDEPLTRYSVVATAMRPDGTTHKVSRSVLATAPEPPATSLAVTGLTPGLEYSFTVSATSAVGSSAASTPFGPVRLSGLPAVPVIDQVVGGAKQATVVWTAPSSDESLTRYTVQATATRADGSTHRVTRSVTDDPLPTVLVVTGLLPGLSYSFTVSATSAVGTSAASTPFGPVTLSDIPGVPVITAATPGARSVSLEWVRPASDESISSYTVVATAPRPDGTTHRVTRKVSYWPLSTEMTGLTVGLPYSFTVSTTSAAGTSAASAPFGPVVPTFGVSIGNRSSAEGNSGQRNFSFTVTLTDVRSEPVSVQVATEAVTAESDDYQDLSQTVTFDPGQRSRTVVVRVSGDTVLEPDESFRVVLSNPSSGVITTGVGVGTILNDETPPPLSADVMRLSTGAFHACAVSLDGTAKCWGRNLWGQIGNGSTTPLIERDLGEDGIEYENPPPTGPTSVVGLSDAVSISAGQAHTCALRSGGTVRCWGSNSIGQLGDGTTTSRATPVDVPGLTDVVSVVAGGAHTCALRVNGEVRCWGSNSFGRLGDGTTTDRLTPTPVIGLGGAVSISAGTRSTCAVMVDATVRCWGENGVRQLGDGTNVARSTPVEVVGLTGATVISAGDTLGCAVLHDGTGRCWGQNYLGDGTNDLSAVPVQVLGLSDGVGVSAGRLGACVLRAGGRLSCWGINNLGQVGDGTFTERFTPVDTGLAGAVAASSGGMSTCAITTDELVRCWGSNEWGHFGNVNGGAQGTPVVVTSL